LAWFCLDARHLLHARLAMRQALPFAFKSSPVAKLHQHGNEQQGCRAGTPQLDEGHVLALRLQRLQDHWVLGACLNFVCRWQIAPGAQLVGSHSEGKAQER
jgi:hypothetical protein